MKVNKIGTSVAGLCVLAGSLVIGENSSALTIVGANRTGTLDAAVAGATATDANLFASTVDAAFPSLSPWTEAGHLDSGTGLSDSFLTITLTTGNWGDTSIAGTWSIDPSFWTTYASAVIGWHVGNGQGNPDEFMFLVKPGETGGTWSYQLNSGHGGGFSNMQLFGSGVPTPDGGSTVLLLGLVVGGLGAVQRFVRKA